MIFFSLLGLSKKYFHKPFLFLNFFIKMWIYGVCLAIFGCIIGSIGKILLRLSHIKSDENESKSYFLSYTYSDHGLYFF